MKRIPEHELMDDVEHAKAYAEADFSEAHDAFVAHFAKRFPDFTSGRVLDLGCGTCDVIIRFAHSFPETQIIGIDGAQAMLDLGLCDLQTKGITHQITLKKCRLPDADLSEQQFDAVISNSLLHHVPDPIVLWDTIRHCAKLRAPIFIMDLLRPENKGKAGKLVQKYATDALPILQKDFYNSLVAAYNVEEIRQQLTTAGLGYLTVEIVSDRHVLVWGKKGKVKF